MPSKVFFSVGDMSKNIYILWTELSLISQLGFNILSMMPEKLGKNVLKKKIKIMFKLHSCPQRP